MKARFDRARDLYREQLPAAHPAAARHGQPGASASACATTTTARLGCSGCPQRACRNDNRLAKTLLMAALVPEAKPFKGLTVKRLVHLNHGTIASPIPGAEMQVAAQRLRDWASQVGALRLGEQADPEVSHPPRGRRPRAHPRAGRGGRHAGRAQEHACAGCCSRRSSSTARARSSRPSGPSTAPAARAASATATCARWTTPTLDVPARARVAAHRRLPVRRARPRSRRGPAHGRALPRRAPAPDAPPNPTVVWLPDVLLALARARARRPGRPRAHPRRRRRASTSATCVSRTRSPTRADLASLRAQKEALIKRTLAQAYGLDAWPSDSSFLDQSRAVDEHFMPLLDDLDIRTVLAGTMKDGFRQVVDTMLSKRYPHHPRFDGTVSATRMEKVGALVERLLDERDRRMNVEKGERNDLRAYADPLGITETGDVAVLLRERPFQEIEQQRQQAGHRHADRGQRARLARSAARRAACRAEVQDVLISLYASWSGRTLPARRQELHAAAPGPAPRRRRAAAPRAALRRPSGPRRLNRAGELFGVAIGGRSLGARNLSAFADKVKEKLREVARRCRAACCAGSSKIRELRDGPTRRRAPARDGARLGGAAAAALAQRRRRHRADLASFTPETSITAMGRKPHDRRPRASGCSRRTRAGSCSGR